MGLGGSGAAEWLEDSYCYGALCLHYLVCCVLNVLRGAFHLFTFDSDF